MKVISIETLKVQLKKFSVHNFEYVSNLKPYFLKVAPSELVDALIEAVEVYEIHDLAEQVLMCSPASNKPYLQLLQEYLSEQEFQLLTSEEESALTAMGEFAHCYEALENARISGQDIEQVELISEEEIPCRIKALEIEVKNVTPKIAEYVDWKFYFEATTYNEYSTVELDLTEFTGESGKYFYRGSF
ncbi:hypothetical protein A7M79_01585 [Acinetobacter baumannii]|uniref:hypothetical protein n=1 Tax=Acinetobacter baumannii TaxID=470 RepID=UPI0008DDABF7|nr:hypothetical protein [Acinetobacter baumannii]OIH12208.1 hypothetical protein A7M79_01585 [Acinetobacter baumannii]